MTELQKAELDLLCKFIEMCQELKLPYFLVCGSALGAVKYKGFIPWDDDIDVGMPREAYEIFISKAKYILKEPYFLQNYKTDKNTPVIFSKLRNSQTTYIESSSAHLQINHGVYIDIFPLDGYPKNGIKAVLLEFKKRLYTSQASCSFNIERTGKSKYLANLWRLLGYHRRTERIIAKYTKKVSKYKSVDSDLICNHGNWQGKLEYAPKEQYGEGVWATFEGLRVRIPEKYDEYLTQKYGDWRADLPKEQQVGHHYYKICDLDKPYTFYVQKNHK